MYFYNSLEEFVDAITKVSSADYSKTMNLITEKANTYKRPAMWIASIVDYHVSAGFTIETAFELLETLYLKGYESQVI